MTEHDARSQVKNVSDLLRNRLNGKETCVEVIDAYDGLIHSVWEFTSRLIGNGGTRALLERSAKLAGRKAPLVRKLRIADEGIDFSDLLAFVEQVDCDRPDLVNAFLRLSLRVFWVLSELTGESVIEPLLQHLHADCPSESGPCGCCNSNGNHT